MHRDDCEKEIGVSYDPETDTYRASYRPEDRGSLAGYWVAMEMSEALATESASSVQGLPAIRHAR